MSKHELRRKWFEACMVRKERLDIENHVHKISNDICKIGGIILLAIAVIKFI